jgi:hypothetical protein
MSGYSRVILSFYSYFSGKQYITVALGDFLRLCQLPPHGMPNVRRRCVVQSINYMFPSYLGMLYGSEKPLTLSSNIILHFFDKEYNTPCKRPKATARK